MRLINLFRVAVAVVSMPLLATTAHAASITFNFSGTVDLTAAGGPAVNTFSGSMTWDPATPPIEVEPNDATYDVLAYSFIFNGTDVTGPILGDGIGVGINVQNDLPDDALYFYASFRGPASLALPPGDLILVGVLGGPTSMFGSTALPGDLGFLSSVAMSYSDWYFEPDDGSDGPLGIQGTLVVNAVPVPVPEPASLTLTALGVAGLLSRARRARSSRR